MPALHDLQLCKNLIKRIQKFMHNFYGQCTNTYVACFDKFDQLYS